MTVSKRATTEQQPDNIRGGSPVGQFSMTCTCGHVMSVEAPSRQGAVQKLKGMMSADAVATHMAERHKGQPVPPVSAVHAMIDQGTRAG